MPPKAAANGWSDEDRHLFNLQIIRQLLNDGKVKLSAIEIPGRTEKALSHQYTKLRAELAALPGGIPPPKSTGRKKKAAGDAEDEPDAKKVKTDNNDETGEVKVPKKRGRPAKAAVKKETAAVKASAPEGLPEEADAEAQAEAQAEAGADSEA